jgi:hypothetical protein
MDTYIRTRHASNASAPHSDTDHFSIATIPPRINNTNNNNNNNNNQNNNVTRNLAPLRAPFGGMPTGGPIRTSEIPILFDESNDGESQANNNSVGTRVVGLGAQQWAFSQDPSFRIDGTCVCVCVRVYVCACVCGNMHVCLCIV